MIHRDHSGYRIGQWDATLHTQTDPWCGEFLIFCDQFFHDDVISLPPYLYKAGYRCILSTSAITWYLSEYLNKILNNPSSGWWNETPYPSCDVTLIQFHSNGRGWTWYSASIFFPKKCSRNTSHQEITHQWQAVGSNWDLFGLVVITLYAVWGVLFYRPHCNECRILCWSSLLNLHTSVHRTALQWRHNGRDGVSITSLSIVYPTVY